MTTLIERSLDTEQRERRARTLEAAALELEVCGWTQGTPCDDKGQLCLMGAIAVAMPHMREHDWVAVAWTWDPDWRDKFSYVEDGSVMPLAVWNDESGRTAAEVKFLLRWRATEIRDGC